VLDVALAGGVYDFTDGKYVSDGCDHASYLEAQRCQAVYLLDQLGCPPGGRVLDIGCGYGRLLQQAAERGWRAEGITISPLQVHYCRRQGLMVHLLNYREMFADRDIWAGAFQGVVANGSLEHFAQVTDAAAGRTNAIYEEFFQIAHRLLVPGGRLVTTTIHFRRPNQVAPHELLRGPASWRTNSANYHFASVLLRNFGGWYPEPGQLEHCASSTFRLIAQEDGTHDYCLTSEHWLRQLRRTLLFSPRVWGALARKGWHSPLATWQMLRCQFWDQSWAWQFRPPPPTQLLRQTWQAF
jgi:cyclopropane-fatty-acyl-phospholipid synthase